MSIINKFILLVALGVSTHAACPPIVSRAAWGARSATYWTNSLAVNPAPYVIIHHTVTPQCTTRALCSQRVKNIQTGHIGLDYGDIGYSFLIGSDGSVYEGRGWGKQGAHSIGYNTKSIGISFIGDFTSSVPSANMQQLARDLISCGVSLGKISSSYKLIGHRAVSQTACPGNKLFDIIAKWPRFSTKP